MQYKRESSNIHETVIGLLQYSHCSKCKFMKILHQNILSRNVFVSVSRILRWRFIAYDLVKTLY